MPQVDADTRQTPGWKYNHWEMKGVPVRIEVGGWVGRRASGYVYIKVDRITGPLVSGLSAPRSCFHLQVGPKDVEANACVTARRDRPGEYPSDSPRLIYFSSGTPSDTLSA